MINIAFSPDMPDQPRRPAKPLGVTVVRLAVSQDTLCRFGVSEDQCELTMAFDTKEATESLVLALERLAEVLRSEQSAPHTSANE